MGIRLGKVYPNAPTKTTSNIIQDSTGWLPHRWQLLQTGPEMPNFDENKKVRHVLCIEFREEFMSGFDNRQFWVLAIFVN